MNFNRRLLAMLAIVSGLLAVAGAYAQSPTIPNFFDPAARFTKPDVSGLQRLRFLTVTDFPPFSYVDDRKRLVGFHVELAQAICEELDIENVCEIQALPFAELEPALGRGEGEALMAGLAITADTRKRLDFTLPYFRLPARFLVRGDARIDAPLGSSLSGRTVAVLEGTAHAAFLRRFFQRVTVQTHKTREAALASLKQDKAQAVFGDALPLANAIASDPTLRFAGGPFLDPRFFGHGLAIALRPEDDGLRQALNFALVALNDSGRFEELYLRHFPVGIF